MPQYGEIPYDRAAAVTYAIRWAYARNPNFYNFNRLGGDCTNFASQCLYAGGEVMNFTPIHGWYYIDLNHRAPAWTGVEYFHRFLVTNSSEGPFGRDASLEELEPGDFVQIRFQGASAFGHTPIIVGIYGRVSAGKILVAAQCSESRWRPLSTYRNVAAFRFIHIEGFRYLL